MKSLPAIVYSLLLAILAIPASAGSCIEIKDRRHLPEGIYQALKNYSAILIGEVHGTNESVQFVEGIVDLWLASGEKVLLGLEIDQDHQGAIDEYLRTGNVDIIKRMQFFKREQQDGRSSVAMANLIMAMYKRSNLKIVCIDLPSSVNYRKNRDSIMAANLTQALKDDPGWKVISLTGNVHNKLELGGFGYPMGYWVLNDRQLKLNKEQVASVDVVFETGSSWNCQVRNGISVCKEYLQGDLAGELARKCAFEDFFSYSDQQKFFFTRRVSTSPPFTE